MMLLLNHAQGEKEPSFIPQRGKLQYEKKVESYPQGSWR